MSDVSNLSIKLIKLQINKIAKPNYENTLLSYKVKIILTCHE